MSAFFGYLSGFLGWVGHVSAKASVLIVLILLVEAILRDRLTARWRYALWLLLVARLVLPWAPETPFSAQRLIPLAQPLMSIRYNPWNESKTGSLAVPGAYRDLSGHQGLGQPPLPRSEQNEPAQGANLQIDPVGASSSVSSKALTEIDAYTANANTPVAKMVRFSISSLHPRILAAWVWIVGVAILGGFALFQSIGLMRAVGPRRFLTDQPTLDLLEDCKEEMGIRAYLAVVETNKVGSPALFGFIRPRLLLPAGTLTMLSRERLRHVFLHELAHLKRGDVAINWLMTVLQVVHWFNPLVWVAFSRMRAERELACDALVLSRVRPAESADYGRTIIHLLEQFTQSRRLPSLAGVLEDKNLMKRRITMVKQFSSSNSSRWSGLAVVLVILLGCVGLTNPPTAQEAKEGASAKAISSALEEKVAQLDFETSGREDVVRIFGEPVGYIWGSQKFTVDNLPARYCILYPNRFMVEMLNGCINEIRFEGPSEYLFQNRIQVGSSLDDVLKVLGNPKDTVMGRNDWKDGVLYKDIDGEAGFCYYCRPDQGVRLFFANYKVTGLYLTRAGGGQQNVSSGGVSQNPLKEVRPVAQVNEYDDIRGKDLSGIDLSSKVSLIPTLTFNRKTVWPVMKDSAGASPEQMAAAAMNPGLGILDLHRQGITGKGVNVAIIDQPLYEDHPEFAGKIAAYFDSGCDGEKSSMHGPAVASLLVGTNCGTAPGARVYYAAAPSWKRDAAYYAKSLDWIIEQNADLPAGQKIRVISVSAAPSGEGSPFTMNQTMWDEACVRAEAAGMLVLDCSSQRGFIGACWYDAASPDDVTKCTPGFPGRRSFSSSGVGSKDILVPASPRTTAEEYDKGQCSYQYCGRGGLSWSIPYAAGVFAMGWQVRPDLSPRQIRDLLFQSAHTREDGTKIIDPKAFTAAIQKRS